MSSASYKVAMVLWIDAHGIFNDVVLQGGKNKNQIEEIGCRSGMGGFNVVAVATLTKLLMSSSSSFWASCTASSVPITVMSSWSLSSAVGKMILAPVLSRTLRMFPPPFPIRNLWYSGLARSSAVWLFVCCHKKVGKKS